MKMISASTCTCNSIVLNGVMAFCETPAIPAKQTSDRRARSLTPASRVSCVNTKPLADETQNRNVYFQWSTPTHYRSHQNRPCTSSTPYLCVRPQSHPNLYHNNHAIAGIRNNFETAHTMPIPAPTTASPSKANIVSYNNRFSASTRPRLDPTSGTDSRVPRGAYRPRSFVPRLPSDVLLREPQFILYLRGMNRAAVAPRPARPCPTGL
jgi:hypothetical protein